MSIVGPHDPPRTGSALLDIRKIQSFTSFARETPQLFDTAQLTLNDL